MGRASWWWRSAWITGAGLLVLWARLGTDSYHDGLFQKKMARRSARTCPALARHASLWDAHQRNDRIYFPDSGYARYSALLCSAALLLPSALQLVLATLVFPYKKPHTHAIMDCTYLVWARHVDLAACAHYRPEADKLNFFSEFAKHEQRRITFRRMPLISFLCLVLWNRRPIGHLVAQCTGVRQQACQSNRPDVVHRGFLTLIEVFW